MNAKETNFSVGSRAAAWAVHLFTATGGIAGVFAITELYHEDDIAFFWYLVYATFVDSLDGFLARRFRVKEVLPRFDGALLDNIVDYFTYVLVPAVFIYEREIIPDSARMVATTVVVLSSAYQFCQADAKTDDHHFRGWPSYWNIVVFYLFFLQMPQIANLAVVLLCAIFVFVPIKYLYPSRTIRFRTLTLVLSSIWALSLLFVLILYPQDARWIVFLSLAYVVYYMAVSVYVTVQEYRVSK